MERTKKGRGAYHEKKGLVYNTQLKKKKKNRKNGTDLDPSLAKLIKQAQILCRKRKK